MKNTLNEKRQQGKGVAEKFLQTIKALVSPKLYEEIAREWQAQEESEEIHDGANQSTLRPL